MLKRNFYDFYYDWSLIITFILLIVTSILTFWRFNSHKLWFIKTLKPSVKENLKLNQPIILDEILEKIRLNVKDFFADIVMLLLLSFNIVGFWRYSTLYRRYKLKKLTRKDMI